MHPSVPSSARHWEATRQRLLDLREPASALERRVLTLAAKLAEMSERHALTSRGSAQDSRVLFVAADRLRELGWVISRLDWSKAGQETRTVLEGLVWRMNLLALECATSLPEESNAMRELDLLAKETRSMEATWRALSADLVFAGGEGAGQSVVWDAAAQGGD